jgi:hypothetical protein
MTLPLRMLQARATAAGEQPPDPAPHPLIYWGDLSVTGNGDLPLATQRRVESIASGGSGNRGKISTILNTGRYTTAPRQRA